MVSAINSVNQYIPNMEDLEIIRRMQSLGLSPSGDKAFDRQRLQAAEIQKRQSTLAANSAPALNRLEGTGRDFSATLSVIRNTQPTNNVEGYQNGLIDFPKSEQNFANVSDGRKMIGALQLAELNKLKLGLIA